MASDPASLIESGAAPRVAGAVRIVPATSGRSERLRRLVLGALAATPRGLTADEIAAALDESVLAVRPRVSELFHAGLIEKTGERRPNASGLCAHVWKKAAAGAS
jgi:predicted ArsR family transcriptional regulator